MSKQTVESSLSIEINVNCPECDCLIDILNENETDGTHHDDDGFLIRQVFSHTGSYDQFECEGVVCTKCKTEFNIKGLEW